MSEASLGAEQRWRVADHEVVAASPEEISGGRPLGLAPVKHDEQVRAFA